MAIIAEEMLALPQMSGVAGKHAALIRAEIKKYEKRQLIAA